MDIFSHLVFGALMYLLFFRNVTYDYFFLAIFFVVLLDFDVFLTPLKRKFKSNYLDHRGGSHSYIIGMIISLIVSLIYSPLTNKPFFIVWVIGTLFYSIHVSQDILTTTKIPCFYPLSKKEYGFYVEKAGSFFTLINSMIFLTLLAIFYLNSVDLIFYVILVDFYTYFFLIYYLYRIMTKILISSRLRSDQKYFPGVLPFIYLVLDHKIENNHISFRLVKKSHFSKSKEILSTDTFLNPEEMIFFKKALEKCNNIYYYAKWTIFPKFIRNKGAFSVRFYFLEIMMNKNSMYIQFNFDILTQHVISINQKRGSFQSV
ncbi:MAG: metal-dependent hydrolase [Promethearchaeota archaeon]